MRSQVHTGRRGGQYEPAWNRGGDRPPTGPASEGKVHLEDVPGLDLPAIARSMRWPGGDAEADDLVQGIAVALWWSGAELPPDVGLVSRFIRAWARRRGFTGSGSRLARWRREVLEGAALLEYATEHARAPDAARHHLEAREVVDVLAGASDHPEVLALLIIGEIDLRDATGPLGYSSKSAWRLMAVRDAALRRAQNIMRARDSKGHRASLKPESIT